MPPSTSGTVGPKASGRAHVPTCQRDKALGHGADGDVWRHVTRGAPRPRARLRGPLTVLRACAEPEAKGPPSWDCGGRGAWPRGGRGQLRDRGDSTRGEPLELSGAMLWFQGAIPAAIASAKRSGAVFVVFVAGERSGGPRYGGDTPSGLPPTSGGPSRSFVYRKAGTARP